MDGNFVNDFKLKYKKELKRNEINTLNKKIVLQFISIRGCDNKSFTISVCPFWEANINGVSKAKWYKFYKWFQIEI